MARLVLLRFGNNAEAENFVKEMFSEGGIGLSSHTRVEWVLAQPTKPCTCNIAQQPGRKSRRKRTEGSGFTKTRHFGWWVHAACRRPSKLVIDRFTRNLTNGHYDLLPEILAETDMHPVDIPQPNDTRQFDENWRTKR
jgi:hypothetical protein